MAEFALAGLGVGSANSDARPAGSFTTRFSGACGEVSTRIEALASN